MKKLYSLLVTLFIGYAFGWAETDYVVGVTVTNNNGTETVDLWTNGNAASFSFESNTEVRKVANSDATFIDGTTADTFKGWNSTKTASVCIGQGDKYTNTSKIKMVVTEPISDVRIYYTGESTSPRDITIEGYSGDVTRNDPPTVYNGESSSKHEDGFVATVNTIPAGTYYIYAKGYDGGFAGMKYVIRQYQQPPRQEPTGIVYTTSSTTWDFSEVEGILVAQGMNKGSLDFDKVTGYDTNTWYTYYYLLWRGGLRYKTSFPGQSIEFMGKRPIQDSKYAQDGTLRFYSDVKNGAIRVTFTDTGTDPKEDAHRRYLSVNDNRTDYWVSRPKAGDDSYESRSNVTTGLIPVEQGWVYIRGAKENGANDAIRVSKIEFVTFGENEGVVDDMFTQRIYSDGGKTSTWTYMGYANGTHGLIGGVIDNEILYKSNERKDGDADNGNGNIKFKIDEKEKHSYMHFLSCHNESTVNIPVPEGSSGTLSVLCTNGEDGRSFDLFKNGYRRQESILPMAASVSTYDFKADDITYITDEAASSKKAYLQLVDNGGEMKVLWFSVKLTSGRYDVTEPEGDYDHGMGAGHKHAVFNFTQGDLNQNVNNDAEKSKGTLILKNGSKLTGERIPAQQEEPQGIALLADNDEVTATIGSFRGGDLVKYKNNYYGSLQLVGSTNYTVESPNDYYITTSIRLHGQNNRDVNAAEGEEQGELAEDEKTYVSKFSNGDFTDTYFDFPRNDFYSRTTTLDFEVTAAEAHGFNFANYQFLGVADAILVKKSDVPSVIEQVWYTKPNSDTPIPIEDGMELQLGGKITYSGSNELWWYFTGPDDSYGPRNVITSTDYPESKDGKVKDMNRTKTFSVRNYKFVHADDEFTTEKADDLNYVYNNTNYYPADTQSSPNSVMARKVEGDSNEEKTTPDMTLNVKKPGTFYFYLKDPETKFNSVLVQANFIRVQLSGVEDVVVEEQPAMEEDVNAPIYNVYGQRVDSSYRGVVIKNGRKFFQR